MIRNRYTRLARTILLVMLALFIFNSPVTAQVGGDIAASQPVYLPFMARLTPRTPTFTTVPPEAAWTAAWWQWAERLGGQFTISPIYEDGDVDCSRGQDGNVWFLAGSEGINVLRRCTVPADKTLLVPVHTVAWHNESYENLSVGEKRDVLAAVYSDAEPGILNSKLCTLESNVQLALDGQPVGETVDIDATRLQSPTFRRFEDNEAVSDGYWFAVQFPAGQYVLHFVGSLCEFDSGFPIGAMSVDVTYVLDVK